MKTSNKLLLSALALALSVVLIFIILTRLNVTNESTGYVNEENIEKILRNTHDFEAFDLGFNNEYILDDTYDGISVSGPLSAVESVRTSDKSPFRLYYEGDLKATNKKLKVRVGIKGKEGLKINVNGNSSCKSTTEYLNIKELSGGGNAGVNLDIKTDALQLHVSGNARITSQVDADVTTATASGNSKIYLDKDSQVNAASVSISVNGRISGGKVSTVSGSISGNGKLELDQVTNKGDISTSGNGRDRSNYTE